MTFEALAFLKNAIKVFKSKLTDVIFVYDGVVYSINEEKSCIKSIRYNNPDRNVLSSLNYTVHVAEAIKKNEIETLQPYVQNVVNVEDNGYTYYHKVRQFLLDYGETIQSFIVSMNTSNKVCESNDLIHDVNYCSLLEDDIFAHGTGYGKILTPVRNPKYRFTLYKGLIPYLKSDRIELWFIDADNVSSFTDFKVIKSTSVLDVYTRNLLLP